MTSSMDIRFMWRVKFRAWQRQSKPDPSGGSYAVCARCNTHLNILLEGQNVRSGWYAIPRIPKVLGGRGTIDNCVILCPECYKRIGRNNTKEIPYNALPYFEDC